MYKQPQFLSIFEETELITIESKGGECILIKRSQDGQATVENGEKPSSPVPTSIIDVHAIFGVFSLHTHVYVGVVTQQRLIGDIKGCCVFNATQIKLIPVPNADSPTDSNVSRLDKHYLSLLEAALSSSHLYYSFDYPLTLSSQAQGGKNTTPNFDFTWNYYALQPLLSLEGWACPFIMGFVAIDSGISIAGKKIDRFALISRRSRHRVGTRFNRRGVNEHGYVANFVETEQILYYNDQVRALVQVRGSAPFYWTQPVTLAYAPKCSSRSKLPVEQSLLAFQRHFELLKKSYGEPIVVLSLIDLSGRETPISSGFTDHVDKSGIDYVHYHPFDFHHECSKMRYHNLDKLLSQAGDAIEKIKYFGTSQDGSVLHSQNGVVRTNCMDNLDRTNVVKTKVGEAALIKQLRELGVLSDQQDLSSDNQFYFRVFKNAWADNGDAISIQYSGTGALKNDFTRTGKRDFRGMLNDGRNSVMRYYLNNFHDGKRQDAYDFVQGNYQIDLEHPNLSLLKDNQTGASSIRSILIRMVGVFVVLLVLSMFAPIGETTGSRIGGILLLWLISALLTMKMVQTNGRKYANLPKLCLGPLLD
mmetsp:Transcript_1777/g.2507  ORF Transcript_1777/g.2507 Transcript_1777/m.2507 type:complete len:588 (+) Transcript_1777:63-1826(+)